MALVKGGYGGRSDDFQPGGLSYECGHTPHGVDYEVFEAASNMEQSGANFISDGAFAVMFESSRQLTLTDWAVNRSGQIHYHEPKVRFPLALVLVFGTSELTSHPSPFFTSRRCGTTSLPASSTASTRSTRTLPLTVSLPSTREIRRRRTRGLLALSSRVSW
jgi:hypothetical protein